MPEPLDDAVERELRDLGTAVLDQHEARFGTADLGDAIWMARVLRHGRENIASTVLELK